jgi:uncharacterized membrane protein YcaP (DUF421 family)
MFDIAAFPDALLRGLVLTVIGLLWVVLVVRVVGLRTFSKMTALDFIVTLATGSLLATAASASRWPAFVEALLAIGVLLASQVVLARARRSSDLVERIIENEPLLLMQDGEFIDAALRESRVSRSDVIAKLREANALQLKDVRAVVLETTGDITVLHGDLVDSVLLEGVRRVAHKG